MKRLSKPFHSKKFKTLQTRWYQKLKEEGFEDIEDTSSPREYLHTWDSTHFFKTYDEETFQLKAQYYEKAKNFLNDYSFEESLDEKIFEMHTEGLSVRAISSLLSKDEILLNKDKIQKKVAGLIEIMKSYTFKGDEMPLQRKDLISIRLGDASDTNFIFTTWLRSLRAGCFWFQQIQKETYFRNYNEIIHRILKRPSLKITIACLKEDPTVILGYAITEPESVHYVFVKPVWRRIGLLKDLLKEPFSKVTHMTTEGKQVLEKKYPYAIFNPFF